MSKSYGGNGADEGAELTEACERSGVYRARHDPDGPLALSETIIEVVAEIAGIDPTRTVVPLGERIDPDALDSLFTDAEGQASVSFEVCDLAVVVWSDGRIRISNRSVADS
ncbi:hypothetical protein NGM10_00105 [Halorussus salilacus]|uniref:HalOD1 output domain-containing protein n=1 Tax=Halorussus salilacus TaxID=2953750 RepID=UPI00209F8E97|nr:HalOD1 output domain-containing protein [Halorussus salilacus]USZ68161.1 hypothetical protein NGM10_00105 [Halorussus salilacus]